MKREPLAIVGAAVAVCQGLLTLIVLLGWWDLNDQQLVSAMGVIALIGTFILAVTGRTFVTPVAAPQDNNGTTLVPVTEVLK